MSTPLRERSTADLIVIGLTAVVGFVVLSAVIGAVVWRIADPNADLTGLVARVGDLVTTIIGVVAGYLAGKGEGYAEGTSNSSPTEFSNPEAE